MHDDIDPVTRRHGHTFTPGIPASGRLAFTTQNRCPVGASITVHRGPSPTFLAPSFSSLATSAA
jgi:hypothetical protein